MARLSDVKVIKIEKNEHSDLELQYKTSYFDAFKELHFSKRTNRNNRPTQLKPLY